MIFIESPWFCDWRDVHLSDESFRVIQLQLLRDPEAGALIRGARGLRKLRVSVPGRGKRAGARIIYYYWSAEDRCYLLCGYLKSKASNLTPLQLRRLSEAMMEDLDDG